LTFEVVPGTRNPEPEEHKLRAFEVTNYEPALSPAGGGIEGLRITDLFWYLEPESVI